MTSSHAMRRARRLVCTGLGLVLLTGCAGEAQRAVPVAAVDEDPEPAPEPTDALTSLLEAGEVQTVPVFLARDPFRPVVTTAAGGGGGDGGAAPDPGAPTDPAPGSPTDPAQPAPGDGQDGCVSTAAGQVCDGELVELLDVRTVGGQEQADVRVDGAVYTVAEGDRFADSYLVQSLDPPCASFLHGDEAFTLCEGQQVLK